MDDAFLLQLDRLSTDLKRCQTALASLAGVFDFYGAGHIRKQTADGDEKAERNFALAEVCRRIVRETGGDVALSGAQNEISRAAVFTRPDAHVQPVLPHIMPVLPHIPPIPRANPGSDQT